MGSITAQFIGENDVKSTGLKRDWERLFRMNNDTDTYDYVIFDSVHLYCTWCTSLSSLGDMWFNVGGNNLTEWNTGKSECIAHDTVAVSNFSSGLQNSLAGEFKIIFHAGVLRTFYYKNVKLVFYWTDYTVTLNKQGQGTVSGGGTFANGKYTTITATPSSGYRFVRWTDGNTSSSRSVRVTGNKTYTAVFEPITHTLTVNSNNTNYGTVTGGGTYNQGATATLTATAKTGYRFVKWNDGNTQNPRTVTVNGAATYTATFEPLKYYLDLNGWIDEASSGGISPAGTADVYINGSRVADDVTDFNTQYNYGSTYEIKDIKANSGWIYAGVKTGSLTGTITAATSVVLIFNRIQLPEILSVEIAPNPANTGQGLTIKVKTN